MMHIDHNEYSGNTSSTAWKYLLDFSMNERLLVIDMESITELLALAACFKQTCAAYSDADVLARMKEAIATSGAGNILIQSRDSIKVDSHESAFDAVFLSDIDRIAVSSRMCRSGKTLRALLDEFRGTLKARGYIYAAFRNRLGYDVLLNRQAPSACGRFFTLARIRKVFAAAGFNRLRVYALTPDIVFKRAKPLEFYERPGSVPPVFREKVKNFLFRLKAWKQLYPAYAVIARRDDAFEDFFRALIEKEGKSSELPDWIGHPSLRYFSVHNPNTVIASIGDWANDNGVIARIPQDVPSRERCERNSQNLQAIHSSGVRLAGKVPAFICKGMIFGQPYYLEKKMRGVSIDTKVKFLDVITGKSVQLLTDFHRETMEECLLGEKEHENLVRHLFSRLYGVCGSEEMKKLDELEGYIRGRIMFKKINLVWMHGDFKIENVLIDSLTLEPRAVIDWDLSERQGFPLLDILYLFAYNERIRTGSGISRIFIDKIFPMRLTDTENTLLRRYREGIPLEDELIPALSILFWIHHVAYRYDPTSQERRCWERSTDFKNILAELSGLIARKA